MDNITLTIACKKSDNLAFKGTEDGNWYNLNSDVASSLAKINKGEKITIEYTKKGVSRYVSKLSRVGEVETQKTEGTNSSTGFICEVCGKTLKDGKYKKCWDCNKSGAQKPFYQPKEGIKSSEAEPPKGGSGAEKAKTYHEVDETGSRIQRGNALNASAAVASGCGFSDPETAAQFTLELAERFLNWLRGE
jgi:hypothetical protein